MSKKSRTLPKDSKGAVAKTTYGLVIDSRPHEGDDEVMYLGPAEISKYGVLHKEKFNSCLIRNTPSDDIRPSALLGLWAALEPGAKVDVILANPILVLQPFEAGCIEANARLAGFENISTIEDTEFDDTLKRKVDITVVTMNKPVKQE